MTEERLREVYQAVVENGFYSVGREKFLSTDITHDEMKELLRLAWRGAGLPEQP